MMASTVNSSTNSSATGLLQFFTDSRLVKGVSSIVQSSTARKVIGVAKVIFGAITVALQHYQWGIPLLVIGIAIVIYERKSFAVPLFLSTFFAFFAVSSSSKSTGGDAPQTESQGGTQPVASKADQPVTKNETSTASTSHDSQPKVKKKKKLHKSKVVHPTPKDESPSKPQIAPASHSTQSTEHHSLPGEIETPVIRSQDEYKHGKSPAHKGSKITRGNSKKALKELKKEHKDAKDAKKASKASSSETPGTSSLAKDKPSKKNLLEMFSSLSFHSTTSEGHEKKPKESTKKPKESHEGEKVKGHK